MYRTKLYETMTNEPTDRTKAIGSISIKFQIFKHIDDVFSFTMGVCCLDD